MTVDIDHLNFEKGQGLIPAIVQDAVTGYVLMLGFMSREALEMTRYTRWVTFFSRSKNRLWVKGETSGNKLECVDMFADCDQDTVLILAKPEGPVCHQGTQSCFDHVHSEWQLFQDLETVIGERDQQHSENSYTSKLLKSGLSKVAQKVGEESVEVILAAMEESKDAFCGEVADLLFHLLVLLRIKNIKLTDVMGVLKARRGNLS